MSLLTVAYRARLPRWRRTALAEARVASCFRLLRKFNSCSLFWKVDKSNLVFSPWNHQQWLTWQSCRSDAGLQVPENELRLVVAHHKRFIVFVLCERLIMSVYFGCLVDLDLFGRDIVLVHFGKVRLSSFQAVARWRCRWQFYVCFGLPCVGAADDSLTMFSEFCPWAQ